MTMKDELGALDRGTLAAWRAATLIVPMLVALGLAYLLTWFLNRLGPIYVSFGFTDVPGYAQWTLGLSVLIGIATGWILGRYAYQYAPGAAAVVAATHVIFAGMKPIGLGSSLAWVTVSPLWAMDNTSQAIIGGLQVVIAFATAEFVRRRRPTALRGGRLPVTAE
jgi:hypothetical protein